VVILYEYHVFLAWWRYIVQLPSIRTPFNHIKCPCHVCVNMCQLSRMLTPSALFLAFLIISSSQTMKKLWQKCVIWKATWIKIKDQFAQIDRCTIMIIPYNSVMPFASMPAWTSVAWTCAEGNVLAISNEGWPGPHPRSKTSVALFYQLPEVEHKHNSHTCWNWTNQRFMMNS
jgi:hypothetical protein